MMQCSSTGYQRASCEIYSSSHRRKGSAVGCPAAQSMANMVYLQKFGLDISSISSNAAQGHCINLGESVFVLTVLILLRT